MLKEGPVPRILEVISPYWLTSYQLYSLPSWFITCKITSPACSLDTSGTSGADGTGFTTTVTCFVSEQFPEYPVTV
ncbi:hypothetical protein GU926_11145 [Nibribacter ruber]|uniref:Uncharacterized protein n=1 Tax=Nibribacter ruber TaxID=2698458 RepID=A0A6P1P085_9BACT|nr:hypothetical protein [Nibribacter ruber]QHL87955.1 hypothetical protein GU926_11145 [Nibribacter ruber]